MKIGVVDYSKFILLLSIFLLFVYLQLKPIESACPECKTASDCPENCVCNSNNDKCCHQRVCSCCDDSCTTKHCGYCAAVCEKIIPCGCGDLSCYGKNHGERCSYEKCVGGGKAETYEGTCSSTCQCTNARKTSGPYCSKSHCGAQCESDYDCSRDYRCDYSSCKCVSRSTTTTQTTTTQTTTTQTTTTQTTTTQTTTTQTTTTQTTTTTSSPPNCNNRDGWYCNGNIREYRDYYPSGGSCVYRVTQREDCNVYDECILVNQTYAEYRDYYCSNGKCLYTSTDYPGCAVTFCNGIIHYFSNDWITPIKYWQTFSGYLENQMDSKRVNVNITSLGKFAFSFCDDGGNSTFDTYLCLFDYRGNLISQNDDFCELNSKIVSNLTKGYYYLQIVAKNQSEKYDFNLAYKQITCDLVSPNVTIINPYSFPGGNLTVNFNFYCGEWDYSPSRDLNVKLLIDGNEWVECFLNDKNISKDLGWSMDECDHQGKKCKKGKKTSNNMWECDENLYCKHKDYPLIVYSNSLAEFVNVTFTCKLPYGLRGGIHKLSVIPTIYSNPITLKPRVTSFIILPANLINMVKLPMEIVKSFINSILKF